MKKIRMFGLAGALVLLFASAGVAAEVKASGYWWIEAVSRGGWDFQDKGAASGVNHFSVEQKMRTAFTFVANENLKAVLDTQIGTANWGNGMYEIGAGRSNTASTTLPGRSTDGGSSNIMLRRAFVEFKYPQTKVNFSVGFQTVTLPAAFGGGSAILDDQLAAAVVSAPLTDNLRLLAGFTRLVDAKAANAATVAGGSTPGNLDAVFAALPIDFKGVNITPFAMYATGGSGLNAQALAGLSNNATGAVNSGISGMKAYWGGAAFTMTALEPFKVMADFNYGNAKYDNDPALNPNQKGGRAGYMFDVAVQYTGLKMMTPEAFFVYSSGEGGGNNATNAKSERMPVVGLPQNWTIGSFFFGERLELAGFIPTAGYTRATLGYWAAGISLKDITFVDKLSHTVNVLYAKGTNSPDTITSYDSIGSGKAYGGYLTTKDSLWEFDLNTRYKIYDELSAYLYLGYIKPSFDKDLWGSSTLSNAADIRQYGSGNAYKIGFGLNYFF